MSLEKLRAVFTSAPECSAWSMELLSVKDSKRNGMSYAGCEVVFYPNGALNAFVEALSARYTLAQKGILDSYHGIIEYDGSTIDHIIYRLRSSSPLIADEYGLLLDAIAMPDAEATPLEFEARAYVLCGTIILNGEEVPVKFISMQNPVTSLRHKFLYSAGTFSEITNKVITLRMSVDVVIVGKTIYMLTLAGEKLFGMERAYKTVCSDKLLEIEKYDMVSDFDAFKLNASSGHNPRRFVAFNDEHLSKLKNVNNRKAISSKFGIPMAGDKFDVSSKDSADKFVKLLCDRGMVDPFDDNPREVAGSKKWG